MTLAEGRRFGLTMGIAFCALAVIAAWRSRSTAVIAAAAGLGVLFLAAGLTVPTRLGGVYRGWMGLGQLLSKVTTPLFMAIVYYLAVVPVGLLMRLGGRNPLRHAARADTCWVPRARAATRGDMANQF